MNLLLTKDEAWKIYQANGGRGVPPRDQVHSVARAQLKEVLESREYREKIARKFIVNCADCLHGQYLKDDCPHEDEDVCMWQRELAGEILALLEE